MRKSLRAQTFYVTICSTQPAVTNLPRVRQSVTIRGTKACGHRLVALRAPIVPSALLSVTHAFVPASQVRPAHPTTHPCKHGSWLLVMTTSNSYFVSCSLVPSSFIKTGTDCFFWYAEKGGRQPAFFFCMDRTWLHFEKRSLCIRFR